MSSLFKKPTINVPAPAAPAPEAPVVPTIDQAVRAQDQGDRLRRRRGARATQLVPDSFGQGGVFKTTLGG